MNAQNIVYLCSNGHIHIEPCDEGEELPICNIVIDGETCECSVKPVDFDALEEIEEAKGAVCPHCGVHSFTKPPRYKLKETK